MPKNIVPVLCTAKEPDAELDLAQLKFDLSDPRASSTWVRVHDKLEAGEMPPPEADQPSPDERRAALGALHKTLHAASLAQQEAEGRVALRRLNRTQHENTLNVVAQRLSVARKSGPYTPRHAGKTSGQDAAPRPA